MTTLYTNNLVTSGLITASGGIKSQPSVDSVVPATFTTQNGKDTIDIPTLSLVDNAGESVDVDDGQPINTVDFILNATGEYNTPLSGGTTGGACLVLFGAGGTNIEIGDTDTSLSFAPKALSYESGLQKAEGLALYKKAPTAQGIAIVSSAKTITAIDVVCTGFGYSASQASSPNFVTVAPPSTEGGITATAQANLEGGSVTSVFITNPGSGYTNIPTITFARPLPTQATAVLVLEQADVSGEYFIVGTVITNSGNGYQFIPPAVIIQNGGGATAEAILRDGQVVGINITNQGTGIFQTPTITIDVPPSTNVIEGQYKTVNYGDLWTGGLKWSYLYSNAPSEDYSYLGGYFLYNSVVFFAASGLQLFPTYDIGKGVCLIQMQISFVPPTGFTLQGFGFGLTTNFGSTVPTPYENSGTTFAYTSPIATVGSVLTSGVRIIESKTFFCSYGGNTTTTVAPYFYVSGSVYTTGFNVQLTMNTIRLA